ncbi:MAG: DNA polymerase III subunit chi [Pseudomonadota bacterium]|nr:DNA polymerase III subunit chi [Pseudomonadota bacterium]
MADIRFHTLNAAGGGARFRHACKLIEQAYLAGDRVLVWLEDPGAAERFDQLLWTFRDGAFVPHEPLALAEGSEAPVQLFSGEALGSTVAAGGFTTLVNLRDAPSTEALGFARILEVLDGDAACREAGRARFRFYREAGSTPQHIAVTDED